MLPLNELIWPLTGAVVSGGLIGMEREWRGRPAGFRTHILVSLSSCLLMLAALHQTHWAFEPLPNENIMTDPTRMAHGVLTGIGFLCAGVIFRQGLSVLGLTTAASLWMTAALGLLFGAGLVVLASVGTLVTIAILLLLKLVSQRLPAWSAADVEVSWAREDHGALDKIGALVRRYDPKAKTSRFQSGRNSDSACLWLIKLQDKDGLERLSRDLSAADYVAGHTIQAHDD